MDAGAPSRETILKREWYHTIELESGLVTPGWFDTRKLVSQLPFPKSLAGLRCLDVATFDGFWAFEMERRGAAETVAIDVFDPADFDWPANTTPSVREKLGSRKDAGRGFEIAQQALASSVERLEMSVYNLGPDAVGTFDFVYVGSLLMHLRDPIRALERVRSVCRGRLLLVDNIDIGLTLRHPRRAVAALDAFGRPWWWKLNLRALVRAVESSGFGLVAPARRVWMPIGPGHPKPRITRALLDSDDARALFLAGMKGDPHGVVLAAPKSTP